MSGGRFFEAKESAPQARLNYHYPTGRISSENLQPSSTPSIPPMADSTKTCFDRTMTLYDTVPSEYYSPLCSRVLIDYERARFWTWGELQGFNSNARSMTNVECDLAQEQMSQIQCALQGVNASYELLVMEFCLHCVHHRPSGLGNQH